MVAVAAPQATKKAFEEKRDALIVDAQRLEEATKRRYEEKERRLRQEKERVKQEQDVARKLAAQVTAKQYLADLQNKVRRACLRLAVVADPVFPMQAVSKLEAEGHFYDPVLRQVQSEFMPWLMQRVSQNLRGVELARTEVEALVDAAVRKLVSRLPRCTCFSVLPLLTSQLWHARTQIQQRDDKVRADREAAEERERQRLAAEAAAREAARLAAEKAAEEKAARERAEAEARRREEEAELEAERQAEREARGEAGSGDDGDDRGADGEDGPEEEEEEEEGA